VKSIQKPSEKLDTSGLVTAVAMLALSAWVIWESEGYSELAAAFPRTVALIMAAASVVLIGRCLLRLQRPAEVEAGSLLHRGALLLVLVGWAALIPVIGFFLASVAGFVASALTARYESWSAGRWAGLLAMAAATVGLFYGLFSEVLLVPFPQGWLW
jgi:hypothetical protein